MFSEFEVRQLKLAFTGEASPSAMDCVGSLEEELTSRIITKKCRGLVVKKIVKSDGNGALKLKAHIPTDVYRLAHGMADDDLTTGIVRYGVDSKHTTFVLTVEVLDEDDNIKYKAYPNCVMQSGITRPIENGSEEVVELEMEIAVLPDENGNAMYEALADDITEAIAAAWMDTFTYDLVKVAEG